MNNPGYLAWSQNLSLTIDYYFINISEPSLQRSGNFLTCSANITTDFSGADLTTNFSFFRNGEIWQNLSGSRTCLNATECSFSALSEASFPANWSCRVSSGDWSRNSSSADYDSPAEISAQPFQTDNSTAAHSFVARSRATDADGPEDLVSCAILSSGASSCGPTYLEETGNLNEKECSSTCSSGNLTEVSLNFTFSGSTGGNITTETRAFAVPNSPPQVSDTEISLLSSWATRDEAEFSCSAETSDDDSDALSIIYLFFSTSDGTLRGFSDNSTFLCSESPLCNKGDLVKCLVRATDPLGSYSEDYSEEGIEIENSPPSNPNFLTENSTQFNETPVDLEFSPSSDADSDPLSYVLEIPGKGNYTATNSPATAANLSRGNYSARIWATDGESYSASPEISFSVFLNSVPSTPQISRESNGTIDFLSSDGDSDPISYYLLGGRSGENATLLYFGNSTSFSWTPGTGSWFAFAKATDGFSDSSSSDPVAFTISPPAETTTTTVPAAGGGGGGFAPAQNSSAPNQTVPDGGEIEISFPEGTLPTNGSVSIEIGNPTNSTLTLSYDETKISCTPEKIEPGRTEKISCTLIALGTGEQQTVSIISSETGKTEATFSVSGSSAAGQSRLSRAKSQIDRLFLFWSDCSDPEAKALIDKLQTELDLDKASGKSGLESAISSAEKFNGTCSEEKRTSDKSGNSKGNSTGLPTPYLVATPSPQKPANIFARIFSAIASFISGAISAILKFFGFAK
ncbi:MAG: hypothetical protein V1820_02200 [archaeon]